MEPIASPFRSTRTNDEERAEKRAALLRAAARMFNQRGFHATSLDDVAASLGVTKPVIYHHLGNKEQVLFECMKIGLHDLLIAAEIIAEEPGSGLDRLKMFLVKYAEIIMDDFGRCVIRTDDVAVTSITREKVRSLKRQVDKALQLMIERAVADGSAHVEDVRMTAFALAGGINWAAVWHRPDGAHDAKSAARSLVAALSSGLEA
jgi:AcrR family transcriptional regulator